MSITEHIAHPFVSALGWTLLHSVWQFVLILILCRVGLMLTSKSRANSRYIISLLALLSMPVVFGITLARQYSIYAGARQIVNLEFADASLYAATGSSSYFVLDKNIPAFLDSLEPYMSYIFWIYMAGLMIFALHGIMMYYRVHNLKFHNTSPIPDEWRNRVKSLFIKTGLQAAKVRVMHSVRVTVPVVIGLFRPVILLPVSMFTTLHPEQIETILLHELRHIRNKDHYINIVQTFLEILFFYHPAMWWINHQLRSEREKRVDEWVVNITSSPVIYAKALFSLENNRSGTKQPVLAATQSKNVLLTRIKNIMTMKTRKLYYGRSLAALALTFAALVSLAWYDPVTSVSKYGVTEPLYLSSFVRQDIAADKLMSMAPAEVAPDNPPAYVANSDPKAMYLNDGSVISWESLSEKDRAEIRKALEEARLAMAEVNKELQETFNSEEFKAQMRQVNEEVRKAIEQANREAYTSFDAAAFQKEMQEVSEEVRKAVEEARKEIDIHVNSEEFQREMQAVQEEVRRAIEEARREVDMHMNSEEFQEEMRRASEEVKRAMEEIHSIDWEEFGKELNKTMQEVGKTMEELGPVLDEVLREVNIDEILDEVLKSLENLPVPADSTNTQQKQSPKSSHQ